MSILAIRSNRRSETISTPSYGLKDQNWPIIFGIQLMRIHVLAFLKIPSVTSKRVHVRKKHGRKLTCFAAKHSKFGVGGCCRLDLFSLNKIFFAQNFLDVKNNF